MPKAGHGRGQGTGRSSGGKYMRIGWAGAALALAAAGPAPGAGVTLDSTVFVERQVGTARVLEQARALRPGDRVIYVLAWQSPHAARFTVTNPLPRTVAYQASADGAEQVSDDGGRSWGRIEDLKVRGDDGRWRQASPEDVTHVR